MFASPTRLCCVNACLVLGTVGLDGAGASAYKIFTINSKMCSIDYLTLFITHSLRLFRAARALRVKCWVEQPEDVDSKQCIYYRA
jgi:hypothetical protein